MSQPAPKFQYILTDLSGVTLGEVAQADDRKVSLPLLRLPTAQFKMPLWHSLADTVLNTDTLLKVYRWTAADNTKRLLFNGPVISAEEVGENLTQSIAVNAAGPFWRLGKRLIGTTKAGYSQGLTGAVDLGQIMQNLLLAANGVEYTGIAQGTLTASVSGVGGPWHLKPIAECIAELTTGLNSPEFEIVPTEPTGVGQPWPQIGTMNVAPLIGGVNRPDAILEYGTPRANVAEYKRAITRDGILTKGYISLNGWPDGAGAADVLTSTDSAARTARGLLESVVPDGGITYDSLRQLLVDEHIRIRKNPKQVITFVPAMNARPAPYVDYNVGDFVRARAVVRGSVRFDAMFRIWGITFNVDKNGNEKIELELVMP